jgi:hypothetical protein
LTCLVCPLPQTTALASPGPCPRHYTPKRLHEPVIWIVISILGRVCHVFVPRNEDMVVLHFPSCGPSSRLSIPTKAHTYEALKELSITDARLPFGLRPCFQWHPSRQFHLFNAVQQLFHCLRRSLVVYDAALTHDAYWAGKRA